MPRDGALAHAVKGLFGGSKDRSNSNGDSSMHGSTSSRDSSMHGSMGAPSRDGSMNGPYTAGWSTTSTASAGNSQRAGKLYDERGKGVWGSTTPAPAPKVVVLETLPAEPKKEKGFFSKLADLFDGDKIDSLVRSLPSLSLSPSGVLPYGLQSLQGPRDSQEDRYSVGAFDVGGSKGSFFGVFDGHAGDVTAQYCAEMMRKSIEKIAQTGVDTRTAIKQGVAEVDNFVLAKSKETNDVSGSTACFAIIVNGVITVGNVGDSRAVLCRGGKAIDMSVDHRPSARRDEMERVKRNGAWIDEKGMILGYLSMSRAMGEICLKDFRAGCFPNEKLGPDVVISEPEIREAQISAEDEFLIVATDGIWNRLNGKEAVEAARQVLAKTGDAAAAAMAICDKAYGRRSTDNSTVIVVMFRDFRNTKSGA